MLFIALIAPAWYLGIYRVPFLLEEIEPLIALSNLIDQFNLKKSACKKFALKKVNNSANFIVVFMIFILKRICFSEVLVLAVH